MSSPVWGMGGVVLDKGGGYFCIGAVFLSFTHIVHDHHHYACYARSPQKDYIRRLSCVLPVVVYFL